MCLESGSIIYSILHPKKTKIETAATTTFPTTIFPPLEIPVWNGERSKIVPHFASESNNLLFWGPPGPGSQRDIKNNLTFYLLCGFTGLQRLSLVIDSAS